MSNDHDAQERRAELLKDLRALHHQGDPEATHSQADDLLLAYLDDEEIYQAFMAVPRWYA